ncbi:hypothetical protein OROGR_012243 [Orobanche gracilis]
MSRKRQLRSISHQPVSVELALNNDDLLMQILLFFPAKSLIRLKSVCKKWLSLISSDHFCHNHTLRRPKLQQSLIIQMLTGQLFYLNRENVMIPYSLSVLDYHQIVQACHGLLLLESMSRINSYYVYNPTTRRLRKIILTRNDDFRYVNAITLAFDPSKSPYYKVICFRSTAARSNDAYQFEVYDSESHTWKLSLKGSTYTKIKCNIGLYWNDYIFWRTSTGYYFCFNIAKNEVEIVCLSKRAIDITHDFLLESNGDLYSFFFLGLPSAIGLSWEVQGDDHSGWIQNNLRAFYNHPEIDISDVRFLVRDGSMHSVLAYAAKRRKIYAYISLGKSFELVVDLTVQPVSKIDQPIKAFQFGEVLALV